MKLSFRSLGAFGSMDSRGRALNSLAELVAFRNRYILYGTRARYFVHAERDDTEHRLTFHGFTAPFGRPRVS